MAPYMLSEVSDWQLTVSVPVADELTFCFADVCYPGKFFFELDQKAVSPGYPKLIEDVWGISGPIDATFTRINCQGKTYIFKVRTQ